MGRDLFSISCPTCQAKLKVRSESAIGQIVMCPQCDSMVQVNAPPGWKRPSEAAAEPPSGQAPAPPTKSGSAAAPKSASGESKAPSKPQKPAAVPSSAAQSAPAAAGSGSREKPSALEAGSSSGTAAAPTALPLEPPGKPIWMHPAILAGTTILLILGAFLVGALTASRPQSTDPLASGTASASASNAVSSASATTTVGTTPATTAAPSSAAPSASAAASTAVSASTAASPAVTETTSPATTTSPSDPAATRAVKTLPTGAATTATTALPATTAGGMLSPLPNTLPNGPDGKPLLPPPNPGPDPNGRKPLFPPPAVGEVKPKAPKQRIDFGPKLGLRVPQIDFQDATILDAWELLGQLAGAPLSIDLDALAEAGVATFEKVTLKLEDVTVEEAFQSLLEPRRLVLVREDAGLRITTFARDLMAPSDAEHPVGDLVKATGKPAEHYAALIRDLFGDPAGRVDEPAVRVEGEFVVLRQSGAVQRQAAELLDKLRLAARIPAREPERAKLYAAGPRFVQAREALETPSTANFRDTPLSKILPFLERKAKVKLAVDHRGLADVGLTLDAPANLSAVKPEPLAALLSSLLEPLELGWRVVDGKTIAINSKEALHRTHELEVFPLAELVPQKISAADLLKRLPGENAPDQWRPQGPGRFAYDSASNSLVVVQPQALQVEVAEWLVSILRPPPPVQEAPVGPAAREGAAPPAGRIPAVKSAP